MERSVGIQLYMTRDYLGSENEIAETLQRISDIGYDGVELCNFLMRREEVQFWKTNMDRFNLNTLAIHEVFEDMKTDIDECIKRAEFFETTSLVSAGAMKVGFEDSEQVLRLAKELNQVGRQLKAHGLTSVSYTHLDVYKRQEVIQILYRQTFLLERKYDKKSGRMQYVREYRICSCLLYTSRCV